jgi:copper oxidase (laccase) domain-containing protein
MRLFEYRERHVIVQSFGKEVMYNPKLGDFTKTLPPIEAIAKNMGADNVLLQLLANDNRGRFRVSTRNLISRSYERMGTIEDKRIDGVILTREGDAVAFMTRDCPTLVLYTTHGGPIAVLHCSRGSLQGVDLGKPRESIIANAMTLCQILWRNPNPQTIRGFVTLGIAGHHFSNERYPNIAKTLQECWGEQVAPHDLFSPLNLYELILAQLSEYGIERSHVSHDGLDTFSNPLLASKRGGKETHHNLIVVLYKKRTGRTVTPLRAPF